MADIADFYPHPVATAADWSRQGQFFSLFSNTLTMDLSGTD
jgi:hypothetical protein